MPAPVTAPGPRPPPPHASAHALDRARTLLERAFRLPSAERPVGPAPVPNRPRGLAAAAAALVAPFLTSDAELNLAKLMGRVPADVGARDWQQAGMAFERWNARWRVPSTWTPGQVGRGIEAAAALHERLSAGRISPRQFGDAMSRLVRHIDGGMQPPATRSAAAPRRPADPPPSRPAAPARVDDPAALRRQHAAQAAQRGSDAVSALGRAIRSHAEAPTPARRSMLNDAYALAGSLHARDGARHWTPATQRGFAAYRPQAERTLYGAPRAAPPAPPAQASRVTHTRGPGAATGAAADALNREALDRQAGAFENARRIVHERSRTLLPGGPSVAEVAREVYRAQRPALQAAGLGENDFIERVQAPGRVTGMDGGGRIGANAGPAGTGAGGAAGGGPLDGAGRSEAVPIEVSERAARVASLLERAGHPPHLTAALDGAGRPRLALQSEALVPDALAALDRLVRQVGGAGTDRLLDAMLLGYGGEVGLPALILAWRAEPGAQQRLNGRLVLDLGNLVTNLPVGDALHDLEHLVGFRSGPGRGVYLTTMAGERALEYVGGVRSENGYMADAIAAQRAGRPLESAFGFANLLRQRLERHAAGLSNPRASMPDDIRAGMPSRAEFLDALARLEGLKLMLGRGGLDWGGIDLNDATTTRWASVAQRFPAIERIDFAAEFPRAYADMLDALQRLAEAPPTGGPMF
jgi:hypothetical protein